MEEAERKLMSRTGSGHLEGKGKGASLGLVSHFPPGSGPRASEWCLCARWQWKGILLTHWNFQPAGVGWSRDALDV